MLAKPRHDAVIAQLQQLGVRVFAIPDGDVAASILTCMPDSEVDVLYGIGGAPEGGGFRRGDPRPRRGYAGAPAGSPPREGR
ncbi:fructose-bisphosphatase class II [Klebsiella pneumoniae subsp. pneumoniae]|nr:fructose-bisphosphatase class II [Klebsiella pneumoniae subsp. pneumoniae]